MSTPQTPITVSMLTEYLRGGSFPEYHKLAFSAMAMLAEVLNGEYDIQALRQEILEETQP